jgi:phosphoenolpyruvate synthase/pyruvate phosphate dikinase
MKYVVTGLVASMTPALIEGVRGVARVVSRSERHNISHLLPGEVLVTEMTDAGQEPNLLFAKALITDRGGYTCHAAMAANLFGIPAIVGTGQATERIVTGDEVLLTSEGKVYVIDSSDPDVPADRG